MSDQEVTMTSPFTVNAEAQTTIADSCNCNECCPRSCCFPWKGRNVERRCSSENEVEITTTTMKLHGVSQAHLSHSGKVDIEMRDRSYSSPRDTLEIDEEQANVMIQKLEDKE